MQLPGMLLASIEMPRQHCTGPFLRRMACMLTCSVPEPSLHRSRCSTAHPRQRRFQAGPSRTPRSPMSHPARHRSSRLGTTPCMPSPQRRSRTYPASTECTVPESPPRMSRARTDHTRRPSSQRLARTVSRCTRSPTAHQLETQFHSGSADMPRRPQRRPAGCRYCCHTECTPSSQGCCHCGCQVDTRRSSNDQHSRCTIRSRIAHTQTTSWRLRQSLVDCSNAYIFRNKTSIKRGNSSRTQLSRIRLAATISTNSARRSHGIPGALDEVPAGHMIQTPEHAAVQ